MKKHIVFLLAVLLVTFTFMESCRSTIKTRTHKFGDLNVTIMKKHRHHTVRGGTHSVVHSPRR